MWGPQFRQISEGGRCIYSYHSSFFFSSQKKKKSVIRLCLLWCSQSICNCFRKIVWVWIGLTDWKDRGERSALHIFWGFHKHNSLIKHEGIFRENAPEAESSESCLTHFPLYMNVNESVTLDERDSNLEASRVIHAHHDKRPSDCEMWFVLRGSCGDSGVVGEGIRCRCGIRWSQPGMIQLPIGSGDDCFCLTISESACSRAGWV